MSEQPDLFTPERPSQPKKAVNVPATSVEAWQQLPSKDARMSFVVDLVRQWPERTSAELAAKSHGTLTPTTDQLLYVRRGLSDAKAKGLVGYGIRRCCRVAQAGAMTWRLRSR